MMRRIIKHFGPEWGAAVMGTAAISITMQLASEVARPFSPLLYIGLGYYVLATLMFVAVLVPWTLRFFWYPDEVKKDLADPVRGNFFPTIPISFILAGTGTNKLGPLLFGPTVAYYLGVIFFFIGAAGIFIFGLVLIHTQFVKKDISLEHASFAWFIPPVSHLIIPVLGACSMDVYWADTRLAPILFVISMVALGVGVFNFIFVGAAVWHRYTYIALPPGRLAPTAMIAIAPTAIMVIFLMKFAQALEASHGSLFGLRFAATFPIIRFVAPVLWGFSAWWVIVAAILLLHYARNLGHPRAFGWWAYTFPFEAFVVATGLLGQVMASDFLHVVLEVLNIVAVIVWVVVVFATIDWLRSGDYFATSH